MVKINSKFRQSPENNYFEVLRTNITYLKQSQIASLRSLYKYSLKKNTTAQILQHERL